MFSKNALKKMIQELSVPTLVSLTHETLDGIGEELNEEVVANVEMFAMEMKRRIAPDAPQRQKRKQAEETPPTPPEKVKVLQFVVGGGEQ